MIKNKDLNSGNQLLQGDFPGLPQGFTAGFLSGAGFGLGGAGVVGWDGAGFFVGGGAGCGLGGAGIVLGVIYSPCF